MVKLTRIYTRGGDEGYTSLGNGKRVKKYSDRPSAYGAVDEANAAIGLARIEAVSTVDAMLSMIQNDLFDVGADLCTPNEEDPKYPPLRITQTQVDRLETEIDKMNDQLTPLSSFILPGGSKLAALLHNARTIVRRAEREIVLLNSNEQINTLAVKYINRLSDHLFVLSRHVNNNGDKDVLWVPGSNR
jgi:cob(I)alamin adenosyltransferase